MFKLLPLIAEEINGGLIYPLDRTRTHIVNEDRILGGIKDRFIILFALAQGFLCLFHAGDIICDAVDMVQPALLVKMEIERPEEMPDGTVVIEVLV